MRSLKSLFRLITISFILLLSQISCAKQSDRDYTQQDPKLCSNITLSCPPGKLPFYDNDGCGCQPTKVPANTSRYYVNEAQKTCLNLLFKCPEGQNPFFDEQGCGCQSAEDCADSEKKLLSTASQYQLVEIKDASLSFEIPKTWVKHGDTMTWSATAESTALIGFNWVEIESDGWEPIHLLPKPANIIGPYNTDLGWEKGLLYIVHIVPVPANTKDTPKSTDKFELHTIIPRMEAGIAYDFYASASSLEQLKAIDEVHQHFLQSGELSSIKRYISEDAQECQDTEDLNCDVGEQEFRDDSGCGCVTLPVEDAVYDN